MVKVMIFDVVVAFRSRLSLLSSNVQGVQQCPCAQLRSPSEGPGVSMYHLPGRLACNSGV